MTIYTVTEQRPGLPLVSREVRDVCGFQEAINVVKAQFPDKSVTSYYVTARDDVYGDALKKATA